MRWNQLLQVADATKESNGVAFVSSSDGTVVANGTASASTYATIIENIPVTGGHVYLLRGVPAGGSTTTYRGYVQGTPFDSLTNRYDYGNGVIVTAVSSGTAKVVPLYLFSGYAANNLTAKPQLFDLTLMFGAGNEPSTVAEFEALYPASYYPYSAPTLRSAKPTGIESVGGNLLAQQTLQTAYGVTMTVDPDGTITLNGTATGSIWWTLSNPLAAGTYTIAAHNPVASSGVRVTLDVNGVFGSYWLNEANKSYTFTSSTPITQSSIQINSGTALSNFKLRPMLSAGAVARPYEPHWSQTLEIPIDTLAPNGLRSAGSFYDELTETAVITRMHTVTLDGTQADIVYAVNSSREVTTVTVGGVSFVAAGYPEPMHGYTTVKCVCDKLPTLTSAYNTWTAGTKGVSVWTDSSAAFIISPTGDTSITTTAQFIAWLAENPLTITYAIATPTTTPIDPPLNFTYRCEAGGTEEFIIPEGHISAPPITEISYGVNAMDGIADSLARISKAESNINNISDHF